MRDNKDLNYYLTAWDLCLPAFTYAYACLNASGWALRGDGEDIVQSFLKVALIIEPLLKPL